MLKHTIALLIFSVALIFAMSYAQQGVQLLLTGHDWVSQQLTEVFSGGHTGNLLRGSLALLIIPMGIGLVPTLAYWGIRRHWFPYFMPIVWAVWLIQVGALVMAYKGM